MSTDAITPRPERSPQRLRAVDAWKLAKQSAERSLRLSADQLPRLSEFGIQLNKPVNCLLHYRYNEGREARLTLDMQGVLQVECQRCLEGVAIPVDARTQFALLASDTAPVPDELEPAVCGERGLDLQTLIEDELMLQVPQSPAHPVGDCEPPAMKPADEHDAPPAEQQNPFAALAALKGK